MVARTFPTVKSSPVMNKQSGERKEVRLGLMQIVVLLGLTVGSIATAFFLGFFVGRSVGFENLNSSMVASLPKLPVNSSEASNDVSEQVVSEVYAKLNEKPTAPIAEETGVNAHSANNENIPELGSIQPADSSAAPVVPPAPENHDSVAHDASVANESPVLAVENHSIEAEDPVAAKKVEKNDKTLGSALADNHAEVAPHPTAPVVKSPVKEAPHAIVEVEKPKPTVAVVKPSSNSSLIPQRNIPQGWFAQIAAPKQIDDARNLGENLKKSGFAVVIEAAQVRGEDYYRVLVGPESSKSQADVLLKQLKRESYLKGEPFLRMVK